MCSLLIEYSAREVPAVEAVVGPSWWARLMRAIADAYRVRLATSEMDLLENGMLRHFREPDAGYAS